MFAVVRGARGRRVVFWVNQYAVTPDQPGGTRHFDMASELGRLGVPVAIVASDLSLTTRRYSRRSSGWRLGPVREAVEGVEFVWLSAGSYRQNDWRRLTSMLVFAAGVLV